MQRRLLQALSIFSAFTFAIVLATGAPAFAQTDDAGWTLPRTPDGQPDLQGVWANNNATPLERPAEWAGKERLTDEELANLQAAAQQAVDDGDALFGDQLVLAAIQRTQATSYDPTTGNYNQFWIVDRDFNNRTSLVVDPPDGRIPELTTSARTRMQMLRDHRRDHPADTYADRPLSERCVTYGVPRLGAGYNSYYQIFQSPTHVVMYHEMNHDARVIPIDGTPLVDDDIRLWHGDSRGYWEGDTLVIETANYSGKATFRGVSAENMRVTERLTRTGPQTLEYEITINDPTTYTQPWTASIPLMGTTDAVYEYACHEGNIGMEGILAGHRAEEREAAAGGQ
ncbi:MAG: hypothetical protein F4W89_11710 [Acidobacteria bacterium]|nr:hypothetical protein [Acidobacteriota bacterium]